MSEGAESLPAAMLVTRNFPPLVGGMEKLNAKLLEALSAEWRPALCAPRGAKAAAPAGTSSVEVPLRPLPWFVLAAGFGAAWLALRLRPRVVVAGSGLSAPMAWVAAKLAGARLVVYLHGLDVIAPSEVYQRLWLPFIRRADRVLVNSHHTAGLAAGRGVPATRIAVLHPGADAAADGGEDAAAFRQRHRLGGGPLLLSVGRLTPRKGLAEFIEGALPVIVAAHPDAVLAVIGDEALDALHGGGGSQRERIEASARRAGLEANVCLLGRRDDAELAAAYRAADCHVFPVREMAGDVEGFGMVALEAAANGVPTVAFAVGGVPDAVAEGRSGRLVAPGDHAAFADAVLAQLASSGAPEVRARCREFARGLDWAAFGARLRALVRDGDG